MSAYLNPRRRLAESFGLTPAAYAKMSKIVRAEVEGCRSCPICTIDGDQTPMMVGSGFYHTNKRGDIIAHPNAYRRAWGKPIYVASTRRIEVGRGWLLARGLLPVRNVSDAAITVVEGGAA